MNVSDTSPLYGGGNATATGSAFSLFTFLISFFIIDNLSVENVQGQFA